MFGLNTKNTKYYKQLMRVDKPVGIYLLLWPTLWGLVMASEGMPPLTILLVFVAGVVVMRSAGCVINDFADRNLDGAVQRTQNRPLPTGKVTEKEAKTLFAVLIGMAFFLVLFLNMATILLSIVALLLASIYPFMKRYTHLPQIVLGAAFGWAIPMAFMAVSETLPWWMWLLYAANLCWTVAYDTQYAMVDRKHDLVVGIKSTAILFGKYDLAIIALLQLVSLLLVTSVFAINKLPAYSYAGIFIAGLLFIYQFTLTKNREESKCFSAFLNNNWVGMAIAISIAAAYFV